MRRWLSHFTLQTKFILGVAVVAGAALLLAYLHDLRLLNQLQSHYLQHEVEMHTRLLAMALMDGSGADKPDELRRILQEIADGYCYLTVQDAHGRLLATAPQQQGDHGTCIDGRVPLVHDGKPFGTLYYGAESKFIQGLKSSLAVRLPLILFFFLAGAAMVYFLLVRRLRVPLRTITRAAESMANGNLNVALPQSVPHNELGKLMASFDRMAVALRQRIESQQGHAHALYGEQARLQALVSILPVGIVFVDHEHKIQIINRECLRLWGLSENGDYIGRPYGDLIANAHSLMEHPDAFMRYVDDVLKEDASAPFDTPLHDGRIIRSRSCVVPDATGERFVGRVWMFEDIAKDRAQLGNLHALAKRDALTNLYTRHRFEDDLERMFAHARRNNRRLILLYFGLDGFKEITDRFGPECSNKVLREIARTVVLQSRRNEVVYRLGGDEFGILVSDAALKDVEALARRLIEAIGKMHFNVGGHEVQTGCSMGIAVFPFATHVSTALELVQHADLAMYQAKLAGGNRWHVFNPEQPLDLGKDSR